ncbi:Cytochrome P450 88A1 [Dichanthelium oligosanthes]|uniref:Cytochrome P450 88A1 n=1 Tax=Dichanthelium oligosanthes TaxID=888268 RepID=A0A1E5VQX7_9POAL|nr:Cytochrome P450 88A1 [Dichanthelium oligosanthes]
MAATGLWAAGIALFLVLLDAVARRVHGWCREASLGADMGWPDVCTMWAFLRAFKSSNPDAFVGSFIRRFGRTGIYKTFMFNSPMILVTTPDACKRVLMDDDRFINGWPKATTALIGQKSFNIIPRDEHRRLKKLTATPISGSEALSSYLGFIDQTVVSSLRWWSSHAAGEVEFLTELRCMIFEIIVQIFMGRIDVATRQALQSSYTHLNQGLRAMAINLASWLRLPQGFKGTGTLCLHAEQEEIMRGIPPSAPTQKGLNLMDFRKMEYLSLTGYLIPKGWKVQLWNRSVHMDPEVYPDPTKFNPSRWEGYTLRAGTFLPFGLGARLCPGNDLAKLEISVFLHHFLLGYLCLCVARRLTRTNPNCQIRYLPHPRPVDNCVAKMTKATNG